jgi:hypothetical protein
MLSLADLPGGRVDDVRVGHELFNTRFDGGHPAFPAVDAGIRSDLGLGGGGYNVLAP